jgi:RNA polymerase sigma-70 factor (ECF subfamily)
MVTNEIENRVQQAIESLPDQCRAVFKLSRFDQLKYQEIADKLGLSIKTVEAHMGRALRQLRQDLADYLPLLLILYPTLFSLIH